MSLRLPDLVNPQRSLRARFAWLIRLSGLLLAVLTAYTVERLQRQQLADMRGQAMRREALLLARSLDNALRDRLAQVHDTATQPLLSSGLWEPVDARMLLEGLRSQQPALAWLGIASHSGRVLVATGGQLEGDALDSEPWWQAARVGPHIGVPRPAGRLTASLGLVDGQEPWLLDLAVPLVDLKGRVTGVLVARLRWDWLDGLYQSLQPPALTAPGSQSLVLDRDGRVVLGPAGQRGRPLPQALPGSGGPAVVLWPGEDEQLLAWSGSGAVEGADAAAGGAGLRVVVRQPTALAFQDAQDLRVRLLSLGALGTLAFVGLSILLANKVAQPVRALSAAALRVVHDRAPDFDPVLPRRQDEVAEVAQALRTLHSVMAQRLANQQRAQAALQDLNAGLEKRVAARTAELQAANDELDAFAYAVSHDLRAPLRAMSGFSQALLEDHGPHLDAEARGYIDQIILASRRMAQQIEGLLVLSRSVRGGLSLGLVDLSELARTACEDLQRAEPERQVQVDIAPDLAAVGDARMLAAVMANLLGNAWKYTAHQPHPVVRVQAEVVDGVRWFCVSDNGAGFDMAHSARLFKAFSRLHRQDEFPGLGIGLATVARILRRHGGRIEAVSAPGQGASFRFTVPSHPNMGTSPTEALP